MRPISIATLTSTFALAIACHNKQAPSTKSGAVDGGHRYTLTSHAHRGRPLVEYYEVAEMGHAWSGGKDDLMFSDAKGPDASLLIWNFFKQFSR